jgi:protein-S-isoprenylcysteine O-methyltransferase Ste14
VIRESKQAATKAQDAGTLRFIIFGQPAAMIAGFAASFSPWGNIPWQDTALIAGTCLLLGGGILRRICFRTLGKHFTGAVIVTPDQPVIDGGPYRLVRHPSYTAGIMMFFGIGIALGNWMSAVILFIIPCIVYTFRVKAEEKALLETIGEPYRTYMVRTKRFIPFLV